jgi:hypothetical protein
MNKIESLMEEIISLERDISKKRTQLKLLYDIPKYNIIKSENANIDLNSTFVNLLAEIEKYSSGGNGVTDIKYERNRCD